LLNDLQALISPQPPPPLPLSRHLFQRHAIFRMM
jgi:hypothetical protein